VWDQILEILQTWEYYQTPCWNGVYTDLRQDSRIVGRAVRASAVWDCMPLQIFELPTVKCTWCGHTMSTASNLLKRKQISSCRTRWLLLKDFVDTRVSICKHIHPEHTYTHITHISAFQNMKFLGTYKQSTRLRWSKYVARMGRSEMQSRGVVGIYKSALQKDA
jgi:hypothetical protein